MRDSSVVSGRPSRIKDRPTEKLLPLSGRLIVAPAASTPGRTLTRSVNSRKKFAFCSGLAYRAEGRLIRIVKTSAVSKPGFTSRSSTKLFIRSPAPTRSSSDNATSETTSRERTRSRPRPPPELRPPSFRASLRSTFEAWSAGANPKRRPIRHTNPAVKRSTRASNSISFKRGTSAGLIAINRSIRNKLNTKPSAPPKQASNRLSVSS